MTEPQMGDIGFVSIPGGVGWAIRIGQWLNGNGFKNYEHSFIVIDNGYLIEAQPGGAEKNPVSKYAGTNVVYYYNPNLTYAQTVNVAGVAQHLEGVPYSFLDYLSIALLRFHVRPKWLRNYVKTTRHMICSQISDYCYAVLGYNIFKDKRFPGDVTPLELKSQVIKDGWLQR